MRCKRRVTDQPAIAVKEHDLNLNTAVRHDTACGLLGGARDRIAQHDVCCRRVCERFRSAVGSRDLLHHGLARAASSGETGQSRKIHRTAVRMKVEQTLRKLGHFAYAARDRHPRDRMPTQVFEHAADEIPHVDQRDLGETVEFLHRRFRLATGRARDVGETSRMRHIDAALDRMNPGCARIRHHDAGGAQDRQTTHNAEPGIERLSSEAFPVRDADLHFDIARSARSHRHFRDGIANHSARHRVDGRLARRNRKACAGDDTDTGSGAKHDAAAGRRGTNCREHERPVRDIGIVTSVLNDAGGGGSRILSGDCEREGHPLAAWQRHLNRIGEFAGQQRRISRLCGSGRAGAGGPTPAQRTVLRAHCIVYSARARVRHARACRS